MGVKVIETTLAEESIRVDITIERGATWIVKWTFTGIPTSGNSLVTSDAVASAAMQIRTSYGASTIVASYATGGSGLTVDSDEYSVGILKITLQQSYTQTSAITTASLDSIAGNLAVADASPKIKLGVYDLEVTTSGGKRWRVSHGDVYLSLDVTQ